MMSPWTSNLLGRAPANRVEGVFDALYGFMGQAFFSSGHARGPEGWEARSSSVGRGPGCAQVADSGIGRITLEDIPQTFESMGELAHLQRLPLPNTAFSACVPCLAMAPSAALDVAVTGTLSCEPHTAALQGPGCCSLKVCLL